MVRFIDNQRSFDDRIEIDNLILDENTLSTQTGNLVLNPSGIIDCSNKNINNVGNISVSGLEVGNITANKVEVGNITLDSSDNSIDCGTLAVSSIDIQNFITVRSVDDSTSTETGTITTTGGLGVAKKIHCGALTTGLLNVNATTGHVGIGTSEPEVAFHIKSFAHSVNVLKQTMVLENTYMEDGDATIIVCSGDEGESALILKNRQADTEFYEYGIVNVGAAAPNLGKLYFTYGASSILTNYTHTKTLMIMDASTNRIGINNTAPAYSLDVTGNIRATTGLDLDGNLNVKNSDVLIYNTGVTGEKIAESCFHIICNEGAGPLIVEERTGDGKKLKIELRPKIAEIYGGITVKGQDSDVRCDMIEWDAGDGGSFVNLGKLRFNLLNADVQENQVEITTSSVSIKKSLSVLGSITGTLSTAAQTNITSLGTLTQLKVDDLTLNGNTLSSNSNTDIIISPHGTGSIVAEKNISCPSLTLSSGSALSLFSEGNWSPNISNIQIITGTPAYENCRYMRINNNVYLQGRITGYSYQASIEGTTCLFIFDLPFPAISNPAHAVGMVSVVDDDGGALTDTDIGIIVDSSSSNATKQAALWNRRMDIGSLIPIAISLSVNYICAP